MTASPRIPRSRLQAWLVPALLACVLLAAQTLGLLHRYAHGSGLARVAATALTGASGVASTTATVADTGAGAASAKAGFGGLFGTHDDNTCRLVDQLGLSDALAGLPVLALPPALPTALLLQASLGEVLARWAALFDARGPPCLR